MKKLCLFLLSILVFFNSFVVFAQSPYYDLVTIVKEKSNVDLSQIDESKVFVAEQSNHLMLKLGKEPTHLYLAMPSGNSGDVIVVYFEKGEYVQIVGDSGLTKPFKYYDEDKAKSYAAQNGLGTPTEIKGFLILERVLMYSYNVVCGNENYIIPYHFLDDSIFNVTEAEECVLEIGKAYSVDEIIEIFEREEVLYAEYLREKRREEESKKNYVTKDENDDVVLHESDKTEDKREEEKESKESEKNSEELEEQEKEEETDLDKEYEKEDVEETPKADSKESSVPEDSEVPKEHKKSFADVPPTHWAYNEISSLANTNVILGYGNGYFGVNDFVTHEQLSLLLERQFGYTKNSQQAVEATREEIIVDLVNALNADLSDVDSAIISRTFLDGDVAIEENEKYVAYAIQKKLVVGYENCIRLKDKVTRAETAALIYRAMHLEE